MDIPKKHSEKFYILAYWRISIWAYKYKTL